MSRSQTHRPDFDHSLCDAPAKIRFSSPGEKEKGKGKQKNTQKKLKSREISRSFWHTTLVAIPRTIGI
jgi:hypothetical protein